MKLILNIDNDSILGLVSLLGKHNEKEAVKEYFANNAEIEVNPSILGDEGSMQLNMLGAALILAEISKKNERK